MITLIKSTDIPFQNTESINNQKQLMPSRDLLMNQSQGIVSALDLSASSISTEDIPTATWVKSDDFLTTKQETDEKYNLDESNCDVEVVF